MESNVILEIPTIEITELDISEMVTIADYEIANFLVETVPWYQTCSDMHVKYRNNQTLQKILDVFQNYVDKVHKDLIIISCWFNVCKENSTGWSWHDHLHGFVDKLNRTIENERDCDLVLNYFLKNTDNNGTWFRTSTGEEIQIGGKDNSILIFAPSIIHKTPLWAGKTRYTLTCEYSRKLQ